MDTQSPEIRRACAGSLAQYDPCGDLSTRHGRSQPPPCPRVSSQSAGRLQSTGGQLLDTMPWWDARQARLQKASPKQVITEEEQQLKSSGEATAETGATLIIMEEQYKTSEEEKRREAELESRPARERWVVQLFAATVAALLTGQSVIASSFGAIVIDQIKQGRDDLPASEPQLTFF